MAIVIEYPQASLKSALELTKAVDELGGRCTTDMAAEKLGMKLSGGYKALVGAAAKYGLLTSKGGYLAISPSFKDYKLAYSPEEAEKVLQRFLLHPPAFQKLYERFKGRPLPLGHFEKLLIREFGVAEAVGSRVAKYFVDGAKMCGLLGSGNVLIEAGVTGAIQPADGSDTLDEGDEQIRKTEPEASVSVTEPTRTAHSSYTVRISGPGMDSVVAINETDDLDIVDVILKKVRRQMSAVKKDDQEQ